MRVCVGCACVCVCVCRKQLGNTITVTGIEWGQDRNGKCTELGHYYQAGCLRLIQCMCVIWPTETAFALN